MWIGGGDRGEESIFNSCSRVCVMRRELASWLSVRTLCARTHTHTQRHAVGTPSWKHDQTQALCSHAAAVLLRKNVTCFEWWQAAASAMQSHVLLSVCCTAAALLTALWEESLQRIPLCSSCSDLTGLSERERTVRKLCYISSCHCSMSGDHCKRNRRCYHGNPCRF